MNSFGSHSTLELAGRTCHIARLAAIDGVERLPYCLRILLENLLRREDGRVVTAADIQAVAEWDPAAEPSREIAFMPARVLLQDFTGVPAVVDLAAMRDAMRAAGGDPAKINPLQPAELVIDHSVQVDEYGREAALLLNVEREYERNRERYTFLRWGQNAFDNFRVVPPRTGIVHQVNLEYLARVVMLGEQGGEVWAYPDTLVGTDSHTTMINGLGVLGWGVGGIEAEAALLGQPVAMLIPRVVGCRLTGRLPEGATATDLVLRVTELLRAHGVVGKLVEFYGPGLAGLPLADRATIANMAPEYGATCGIFPVDGETLAYLRFTGRDEAAARVEAYCREQGLLAGADAAEAEYSEMLALDLGEVEPALAGPRRPQDRVALGAVKQSFAAELPSLLAGSKPKPGTIPLDAPGCPRTVPDPPPAGDATASGAPGGAARVAFNGETHELHHGSVVIAAITSCTNTSNPSVMVAAGLVAQKAVERGLKRPPWVKTSLAPGSQVVTDYLTAAGLMAPLEALGFHLVGYGCTTCIGNSGPLPAPVAEAIDQHDLVAVSVLSGNRNFEGRVHAAVRANYLASPPLVVAYALAGRIDVDLQREPLGLDRDGRPVMLAELWPSQAEVDAAVRAALSPSMFRERYANVYRGDEAWQALAVPEGQTYAWEPGSTYVKLPPYFVDLPTLPEPVGDLAGARCLALLGDSITTDHISPAGSIKPDSPAGRYLIEHGVEPREFNSYGSRRGNHEVMMRGTFANVRLRNKLAPGTEGGVTLHLPGGEAMSIYDAAMRYLDEGVPTIVIAGREYGSGSSRDWAAKGPRLLGVRAVIAESYERIHRSNLIGMGVAPLEIGPGESAESLGLSGHEQFAVDGLARVLADGLSDDRAVTVTATADDGTATTFASRLRIDTPAEADYYRHGGILHYVLRQLLAG